MTDSTPRSLNEHTTEANLAEAKAAIEAIEAQLLEVKSCIRSVEAVQSPTHTTEQLRALARKFFVMGAEAQAENIGYSDCEFGGVEVEGSGDGLSWTYRGDVYIDAYDIERQDPITFGDVVITNGEIDEVISKHTGNTQAE